MSYHSPLSAPHTADEEPTCTLWQIRRLLGRDDYSDRRMVTYVCQLITREGFPPPLPSMIQRRLSREVTARSRWIRSAVDAWIIDWLPPSNAGAVDRIAATAAAAEMDAAASQLGGLTLIQGGRA